MDLATDDALRNLARRSAHVTQKLQDLLDAQSDGLLRGLGREPESMSHSPSHQQRFRNGRSRTTSPGARSSIYHDGPSVTSETPTSSIMYGSHVSRSTRKTVVPVRQPSPPKPPTLLEARKGITESLQSLAVIKRDEARIYGDRVQKGEEGLDRIQSLIEKRQGLQGQISRLEDQNRIAEEDDGSQRQEHQLEVEIKSLEERVSDLRAELRHVRAERSERSNNRAAEASSYRNALSDVQRTIRTEIVSDQSEYRRMTGLTREGVWSLPKDRRTAELVTEDIQAQIQEAVKSEKAASSECLACDEGVAEWMSVVSQLSTLEKRLAVEIKKLNSAQSPASTATTASEIGREPVHGMSGVLDLMSSTADRLATSLATAEEKGWVLLVCCIGAELEALKEAKGLLGDTLVQSQMLPHLPEVTDSGRRLNGSRLIPDDIVGTAADVAPVDASRQYNQPNHTEDEDDVLDPQALFGADEGDQQHHSQPQSPGLLVSSH